MSTFFQRLTKLHEPEGRVQFVVFEKIYEYHAINQKKKAP